MILQSKSIYLDLLKCFKDIGIWLDVAKLAMY